MLTKHQILTAVARRTRTESSPVFGGDLCLREHSRAEFRAIQDAAALPDGLMNTDRWYGGLFANAVIDAATGAPMFTSDEILTFAERNDLWDEIARIARVSLDLSEVGREAVVKSDLPSHDERGS